MLIFIHIRIQQSRPMAFSLNVIGSYFDKPIKFRPLRFLLKAEIDLCLLSNFVDYLIVIG